MVWKLQSYKKCVNSTRDQMYFCDTGERTTNPNSFRSLRAMKGGPIGIQFSRNQQFQFSVENIDNFNDIEETIENFQWL